MRAMMSAFTFEIGEGGRLETDLIPLGGQCVGNALRFLHMLPGALKPQRETVVMTRFVGIRATRGGLLHTTASLVARVKQVESWHASTACTEMHVKPLDV
jgi:uncharacterized protein